MKIIEVKTVKFIDDKIDEMAKEMSVSKNILINSALSSYLMQNKTVNLGQIAEFLNAKEEIKRLENKIKEISSEV